MKDEVDSGVRTEAPPRGSKKDGDGGARSAKPRKARVTPQKKNDGVISGRVNKSTTPTKKRGAGQNAVKGFKEDMESSASSMMEGHLGGSFEDGDQDINFSFEEQGVYGVHGFGDGTDYHELGDGTDYHGAVV